MKARPYHLQISPKTRFLNFLRKFFIINGFDKFPAKYARNNKTNSFVAKLIPPNYLYTPGIISTFNVDGINFELHIKYN